MADNEEKVDEINQQMLNLLRDCLARFNSMEALNKSIDNAHLTKIECLHLPEHCEGSL
jgi:hypothetical protein